MLFEKEAAKKANGRGRAPSECTCIGNGSHEGWNIGRHAGVSHEVPQSDIAPGANKDDDEKQQDGRYIG